MSLLKKNDLVTILKEKGLINEDSVKGILELVESDNIRFGEAAIRLGLIDDNQLVGALGIQYSLDVIDVEEVEIDEDALKLLPVELIYKHRLVLISVEDETVILTSDPTQILVFDDIERMVGAGGGRIARVALAPKHQIERLVARASASSRILKEVADGFDIESLKVEGDGEESVLTIEKISQDSSPVVKLVDTTIYDALTKGASDIHLESTSEGLIVKYRLDGVLYKVAGPIDRTQQASIISRIKVMSELDISERRIPQDGRFKIRFKDKAIDFRVSIMPCIHGEDAVIRILDKEHITREFKELKLDLLGFGPGVLKKFRRMVREPYGMVLVTGPTGSGKTTTLYAAVSEINSGEDKIITIEDPVEYELSGVVQIPVNEKKGLTFATGLRSVLRHDPDKILVGEIRDSETAQIAIQAALTGHLVFTTVHANNVFDVIGRFIHMGIEPYNFVTSLNCVLAQRLIRLICVECKRERKMDDDFFELMKVSGLDLKDCKGKIFYEGAGCEECFYTGYRHRKAILELLDLTDEIRDLISEKASPSVIKKKALSEGMLSLRQTALVCMFEGETTLEEINRVTFVE